MSCMNDPVGSSTVSDYMHARAADYGHVEYLALFQNRDHHWMPYDRLLRTSSHKTREG